MYGADGVQEAQEAHHGRWYKHVRVEAEPREIQGDLNAVVLPYVVKGLVPRRGSGL